MKLVQMITAAAGLRTALKTALRAELLDVGRAVVAAVGAECGCGWLRVLTGTDKGVKARVREWLPDAWVNLTIGI